MGSRLKSVMHKRAQNGFDLHGRLIGATLLTSAATWRKMTRSHCLKCQPQKLSTRQQRFLTVSLMSSSIYLSNTMCLRVCSIKC